MVWLYQLIDGFALHCKLLLSGCCLIINIKMDRRCAFPTQHWMCTAMARSRTGQNTAQNMSFITYFTTVTREMGKVYLLPCRLGGLVWLVRMSTEWCVGRHAVMYTLMLSMHIVVMCGLYSHAGVYGNDTIMLKKGQNVLKYIQSSVMCLHNSSSMHFYNNAGWFCVVQWQQCNVM